MKTIIMQQTISLLCKNQEEINKLFEEEYIIKELENGIKYLIKDENL